VVCKLTERLFQPPVRKTRETKGIDRSARPEKEEKQGVRDPSAEEERSRGKNDKKKMGLPPERVGKEGIGWEK